MRTRKLLSSSGNAALALYGTSPGTATPVGSALYSNSAVCLDEKHRGPPYRSGGPLAISKIRYKVGTTASVTSHRTVTPTFYFSGKFYCPIPSFTVPYESSLSGWGAIGWSRTIPVTPVASVGLFLGELKDFPKMIRQTHDFFRRIVLDGAKPWSNKRVTIGQALKDVGDPSKVASDYLNLQFGWVPFVKDLVEIFDFQTKLAKKLDYLKKHNGRTLKRRLTMLNIRERKVLTALQTSWTTLSPIISTYAYHPDLPAARNRWEYKTRKIWYEAKYTYWIPELANPNADLTALKLKLLGVTLDPELIYNLVPWTWLLDWFTSTGSVVSNIVANSRYHVVAKYAYVMQTQEFEYTQDGTSLIKSGQHNSVGPYDYKRLNASSKVKYTFKRREVANPYGFGITDTSLSGYQWSILVALGLSRLR
jgi:hypothetical protein